MKCSWQLLPFISKSSPPPADVPHPHTPRGARYVLAARGRDPARAVLHASRGGLACPAAGRAVRGRRCLRRRRALCRPRRCGVTRDVRIAWARRRILCGRQRVRGTRRACARLRVCACAGDRRLVSRAGAGRDGRVECAMRAAWRCWQGSQTRGGDDRMAQAGVGIFLAPNRTGQFIVTRVTPGGPAQRYACECARVCLRGGRTRASGMAMLRDSARISWWHHVQRGCDHAHAANAGRDSGVGNVQIGAGADGRCALGREWTDAGKHPCRSSARNDCWPAGPARPLPSPSPSLFDAPAHGCVGLVLCKVLTFGLVAMREKGDGVQPDAAAGRREDASKPRSRTCSGPVSGSHAPANSHAPISRIHPRSERTHPPSLRAAVSNVQPHPDRERTLAH